MTDNAENVVKKSQALLAEQNALFDKMRSAVKDADSEIAGIDSRIKELTEQREAVKKTRDLLAGNLHGEINSDSVVGVEEHDDKTETETHTADPEPVKKEAEPKTAAKTKKTESKPKPVKASESKPATETKSEPEPETHTVPVSDDDNFDPQEIF